MQLLSGEESETESTPISKENNTTKMDPGDPKCARMCVPLTQLCHTSISIAAQSEGRRAAGGGQLQSILYILLSQILVLTNIMAPV